MIENFKADNKGQDLADRLKTYYTTIPNGIENLESIYANEKTKNIDYADFLGNAIEAIEEGPTAQRYSDEEIEGMG